MDAQFQVVKVTITQEYAIPVHPDGTSVFNKRPVADIVEDWFKNTSMFRFHPTRENCLIGGSEKVTGIEIVSS